MHDSRGPGKLLLVVALLSGLVDLGFGLSMIVDDLTRGGFLQGIGVMLGCGTIGLAVLAAVAIDQSSRGRNVLAWTLLLPAATAAGWLLGEL